MVLQAFHAYIPFGSIHCAWQSLTDSEFGVTEVLMISYSLALWDRLTTLSKQLSVLLLVSNTLFYFPSSFDPPTYALVSIPGVFSDGCLVMFRSREYWINLVVLLFHETCMELGLVFEKLWATN